MSKTPRSEDFWGEYASGLSGCQAPNFVKYFLMARWGDAHPSRGRLPVPRWITDCAACPAQCATSPTCCAACPTLCATCPTCCAACPTLYAACPTCCAACPTCCATCL